MNLTISKYSKTGVLSILLCVFIVSLAGCAANMASKPEAKNIETPLTTNLINEISTSEDSESINVWIKGNGPLAYTSIKQPFPLGVVLYFPETALENAQNVHLQDNDTIGPIKSSELTEKGHTSRIEISLKKDVAYKVSREDSGLKIAFTKTPALSSTTSMKMSEGKNGRGSSFLPSTDSAQLRAAESTEPTPVQKDKEVQESIVGKRGTNPAKPAWINRVDFFSENAGKSTVVIGTTIPVKYDIKKDGAKKLHLELYDTRLPDHHKRPLITTRFESAVDRIRPFQAVDMKNKSMVGIELREAVPYRVEQTGNFLMIHFEASSIPPKSLEQANLPAWKEAMTQTDVQTASQMKVQKKADAEALYSEIPKGYKGEKIALDFFETDIKNVFRILREVSGANFAIDKNVTGKVTLTLDRPVPWDQVLDLVLKMNQLGQVEEGNIIRIASLETLKSEEELRRAQLDAEKKALEQKKELEPLFTEYIPINYAQASEIIKHLNEIKTKDRATISVDDRTNTIIITDVAAKIDKAKKIVAQLDKATAQVIIEARIVEADSTFARELGVQWSTSGDRDSHSLGGLFGWDTAVNLGTSTGSSSNGTVGINFQRLTGNTLLLNAQLQANEATGNVKIISSPKIITLDNREAIIKQGVEWPYLEESESGGTTVNFKTIDLKLTVKPHVTNDNRISMVVTIFKNDIAELTAEAPAINTKEASTELLVNDGETVVIGGINKTTKIHDKTEIPLLSKVPGLGWLFRSDSRDERNEELLIFITPKIFRMEQA